MRPTTRRALARPLSALSRRMFARIPAGLRTERLVTGYQYSLELFPKDFTVTIDGGLIFTGNTLDVIQRSVYIYGLWEPEITHWLHTHLRPGDFVVDVGANSGYFSLQAARIVGPNGRVLALEPVPSIAAHAQTNFQLNPGVAPIELLNIAAASEPGQTEIFRASANNTGNSSTVSEPGHQSEGFVEKQLLDVVLEGSNLDRLRLVKIDTEGDEVRVVEGMRATLDKMPSGSAVLVEVTPDKLAARGQDESDLWRHFPASEWTPLIVNNDYSVASYLNSNWPDPVMIDGPTGSRADLIFLRR